MTVAEGVLQELLEEEVGLGGCSERKEQWGSEHPCTSPGAASPVLCTGTCVCTVVRLLRGKEGATQRPLSSLTRESLVDEVRMIVSWCQVTCEL